MLASMTAGSKQIDSTKNVLKPFCVETWSMIIARRDRTEFVASYTCHSKVHIHSIKESLTSKVRLYYSALRSL